MSISIGIDKTSRHVSPKCQSLTNQVYKWHHQHKGDPPPHVLWRQWDSKWSLQDVNVSSTWHTLLASINKGTVSLMPSSIINGSTQGGGRADNYMCWQGTEMGPFHWPDELQYWQWPSGDILLVQILNLLTQVPYPQSKRLFFGLSDPTIAMVFIEAPCSILIICLTMKVQINGNVLIARYVDTYDASQSLIFAQRPNPMVHIQTR